MNTHNDNFGDKFAPRVDRNAQKQKSKPTDVPVEQKSITDNIENFLLEFLAGADAKLLKEPALAQDRKKYVSIATSVLLTGLMAGCSGGYAFFTAVKVIDLSIGFGIIWGGMILNIDRAMLISMSPKPNKNSEGWADFWNFFQKSSVAFPRILLSLGLGLVISTPLTLKVFEKEITSQIEQNFVEVEKVQMAAKDAEIKKAQAKLVDIEARINKINARKSDKQDGLERELQGSGSGKKGDGKISKALRENLNKTEADLAKEEAAKAQEQQRIQSEIDRIEQKYARESKIRQDSDGFLNRFAAREELKHRNPAAELAIHSLEFLLIAIEVAPLLIKLMSKDGNYEEAIKLAHENTSNRIKKEAEARAKNQAKQQAIDYENQDNDLERKILLAKSDRDPQSFNLLMRLLELDSLKLDLRKKLVDKLLESIEKHNTTKQELDSILLTYSDALSEQERTTYTNLFTQLQAFNQEDLQRTVTLLKSR